MPVYRVKLRNNVCPDILTLEITQVWCDGYFNTQLNHV